MAMQFRVVFAAVVLSLAAACAAVAAQRNETGFLDRKLTLDGNEYLYQVYVPRSFDPARKWPIILALHGGGEYGNDGIRQTAIGVGTLIRRHPERVPAIVVFPQARADKMPGWHRDGGRVALLAVERAIAEFAGDPTRVYLTGYSGGGNGSWFLASRHTERFAAVAVVCGWVTERRGSQSGILHPSLAPKDAPDPYAAVARTVASLPIWIFHGAEDRTVPVEESRRMYAALEALDADVRYTEYPGVGHDSWNQAYDSVELFEWMLKQQKH